MTRIAHLITLAAMVATGAALASWLPIWWLGVLVAAVIDGAWWTAAQYERRIRDTGADHRPVGRIVWGVAALSAGLLAVHAIVEGSAAWAAVAALPLVSRLLGLVDDMWQRTRLTPGALRQIEEARQSARDGAAIARAHLAAQAHVEHVRVTAVTDAGTSVARAQAAAAKRLSGAWTALSAVREGPDTGNALTSVTAGVTPASHAASHPRWELPMWGSVEELAAVDAGPALTDAELDRIVAGLRDSEVPPLTYRELSVRFRAAGHSAGETRLRASWRRVTAQSEGVS